MTRGGWRAALALLFAGACAAPHPAGKPHRLSPEPVDVDPASEEATFLAPNFADADGTPAYVHFTREHMPLLVEVQIPLDAPRGGSPEDARKAVMAGILLWQRALETELDWFEIEFVDEPRRASIVVGWTGAMTSTRMEHMRCTLDSAETLALSCRLDLSIGRYASPIAGSGSISGAAAGIPGASAGVPPLRHPELIDRLTTLQLTTRAAHEFGHVIGLVHCRCDSIMALSDLRRPPMTITELDLRTLLALLEIPNGTRVDGQPLSVLRRVGATP